ncbi:MAG: hypothetical protein M1827_007509 [Pycnora praestabilis]|nr:MAG: hypothetical protein M1827_007509 [Pycnora praestabilis]
MVSTTPKEAVAQDNLVIPLIDFSLYLHGSPSSKAATASQITHGFKTAGFIYLKNFDIPSSTISNVFSESAKFFKRPQSQKDQLAWETPESNRGYNAQGREKVTQLGDPDEVEALRAAAPDLKESMEIGREGVQEFPNKWPDKFGDAEGMEFKKTLREFFETCQGLHVEVMRAIASGMGLHEGFFDEYTNAGDNSLRLLHYPAVKKEVFARNKQQVRAGEHSDYGTMTLLFQDSRGGLQVQSPNGTFVNATPIPDTVVVNAGDILARWSNDAIKSTLHRVVEPPFDEGKDEYPARYSIPYFCNPNFDKYIDAIPGTWEAGGKKYEGINSGEYMVRRLAETYGVPAQQLSQTPPQGAIIV